MAAEKRHPNDPRESMIDEVAERVFINYEPPHQEDPAQEDADEEAGASQPAA